MSSTLRIALLGAGQLGGSFILALREHGAEITVTAYDPATQHSGQLQECGAVDSICDNPQDAARNADIVVLAAPLRCYQALATAIAPVLDDGCIVTDVGSVKCVMQTLVTLLPRAHIVPAHPIAGSEKSGSAAARGDLFRGRLCIITPDKTTDSEALRAVEALWSLAGADVITMTCQLHDQIYAYVSHLPHYIAFVAASYFHRLGITLHAKDTMLHSFLRISRSNPRMWTDIALENREALLPALATYIALLEHFSRELRSGAAGETGDIISITKALLPRVLAASLISAVSLYEQQSGGNLRPFGAGGMRDIVAPAAQSPETDTEAMSSHAALMAAAIEGIIPLFRALETLIGVEDEPALYAAISMMVEDANALMNTHNAQ